MLKIKILKTCFISFGVSSLIAISGLSIISCHSKSTKTWANFKKHALAEQAANLKSTVATIAQYHWNPNAVAVYSSSGKPSISTTTNNTIIATIIIENEPINLQYPISFAITYNTNTAYDLKDWTYNQTPDIDKWSDVKTAGLAITAPQLLAQAKKANVLKNFSWAGDASQLVWQDKDIAEFDVYGGLNDGKDTYKGMSGKPIANDKERTISAIISIKDPTKKGNFDADPIKAVFDNSDNKSYDINNWKFSQTVQLQSIAKYSTLVNAQISIALQFDLDSKSDRAAAQNKFDLANWVNKIHINSDFNVINNIYKTGYGEVSGIQCLNAFSNPIKGGIESKVIIQFMANKGNIYNYTLANEFPFSDSHKNSGPAFNYTWSPSIVR